MNLNLSPISLTIGEATFLEAAGISRPAKNLSACSTESSVTSLIDVPPTLTDRLSGLSRVPRQAGQGFMVINCSNHDLIPSDSVSR